MKQEELTQLIKEVLDEVVGKAFARSGRMSDLGREYTLTPAEKRRRAARRTAAIPATDVNIPAMDPDAPEEPTVVAEPTSPTVVAEPTSPTVVAEPTVDRAPEPERGSYEVDMPGSESTGVIPGSPTPATMPAAPKRRSDRRRLKRATDKQRKKAAKKGRASRRTPQRRFPSQRVTESIQKTIKVKILKSR